MIIFFGFRNLFRLAAASQKRWEARRVGPRNSAPLGGRQLRGGQGWSGFQSKLKFL